MQACLYPYRIGEIPIQRKFYTGNLLIDGTMKPFYRVTAFGSERKCIIQLRQVVEFQHQVELAQMRRRKAQLTPGNPIGNHCTPRFEFIQIDAGSRNKSKVVFARFQITPDVIDIQEPSPSLR